MIVIKPVGGLSNYLRVVLSWYSYARSINSKLVVIWRVTSACNGFFLDFFKPVKHIVFLPKNIYKYKIDYTGYGDNITHGPVPNIKYNRILKLRYTIKKSILKRRTKLKHNYNSVHIRRTDLCKWAKKRNAVLTPDDDFNRFIDDNIDKYVYIATDSVTKYKQFQKKYKKNIKFKYHTNNPNKLRKTSLRDAIIDIYMCVYSDKFMGTNASSFSQLIQSIRDE